MYYSTKYCTGLCRAAERAFFFSGECERKSREGGRFGLYGHLCTLKQEGNEPWMGTGSRTADHPFEVLARRWGRSIAVGCDPWMTLCAQPHHGTHTASYEAQK